MAELTFPASWEVIIVCYPSTCCGLILMEFGLKVMPLYSLTRQPVFVSEAEGWFETSESPRHVAVHTKYKSLINLCYP